jgi:hypothetical protein
MCAGGRAWTMYDCRDLNTRYTSFENLTDKIGIPTNYEVESKESSTINKKTGKPFINYTISLPKGGSKQTDENLSARLKALEKKIDDVALEVHEVYQNMLDMNNEEAEPADEDIPF